VVSSEIIEHNIISAVKFTDNIRLQFCVTFKFSQARFVLPLPF